VSVPDVLGAGGGLLIVGAYSLLQLERLDPRSLRYSVINAIGAGLILFSLMFEFNLGALLVEAFWLLVSCFGIVACLRRGTRGAAGDDDTPMALESQE
jgi:hypothetical protein